MLLWTVERSTVDNSNNAYKLSTVDRSTVDSYDDNGVLFIVDRSTDGNTVNDNVLHNSNYDKMYCRRLTHRQLSIPLLYYSSYSNEHNIQLRIVNRRQYIIIVRNVK